MKIGFYFITGFAFGFEYVPPEETPDNEHCLMVDLGILRVMFFWPWVGPEGSQSGV